MSFYQIDLTNSIDELALASGHIVDEVYAPIIAERCGYQWQAPEVA